MGAGGGGSEFKVQDSYMGEELDEGNDGRPRFREEIKMPPQYQAIDLMDPNDEVLF